MLGWASQQNLPDTNITGKTGDAFLELQVQKGRKRRRRRCPTAAKMSWMRHGKQYRSLFCTACGCVLDELRRGYRLRREDDGLANEKIYGVTRKQKI